MKVVQVQGTKYYIYNKDDAVSLAHKLSREGYSVEEIARLLEISPRTVKKYLQDCW